MLLRRIRGANAVLGATKRVIMPPISKCTNPSIATATATDFICASATRQFSSSSFLRHVECESKQQDRPVRVRFAPSPTGFLHLGGFRTALYNYLFARKHNGSFLLRIEDTDKTRQVDGAIEQIKNTLDWASIPYDEGPERDGPTGPYIQSERLALYQKHAFELVEKGHAYYCFCDNERLQRIREDGARRGLSSVYDRHCLTLSPEEVKERLDKKEPYVIRMKIPEGISVIKDAIRGNVMIGHDVLDDQVLLKSDGFPTYHLASVVDDHTMGITHVIRGEEWLPSTPKHTILYNMFGWEAPTFAHLPLLLNEDRSKLSKRQGHSSVDWYRENGYLPEALINFAAFLGWTPAITEKTGKEVFDLNELVQEFSLEQIHKAGAVVDLKKLNWLNGQHIRKMCDNNIAELIRRVRVELDAKYPNVSDEYLTKVLHTMKERIFHINDLLKFGTYFFEEPDFTTEEAQTLKEKAWSKNAPAITKALSERFSKLSEAEFTKDNINLIINDIAKNSGLGTNYKETVSVVRFITTCQAVGANIAQTIETLGKEKTLQRVNAWL